MSSKNKYHGNGRNRIAKPNAPSFIKSCEPDGESAQVSVRIPLTEKTRFESAQHILRENGLGMLLTDVVRTALSEASDFVEATYSSDASRQAMQSQADSAQLKDVFDVQHSSSAIEEERGAKIQNDGSSTDTVVPTL